MPQIAAELNRKWVFFPYGTRSSWIWQIVWNWSASSFPSPKSGSYTSVLDHRAILAAFWFGSRETELHLAASLGEAPSSGRLFCWTSLQVRSLLREQLTARHWWMSGDSNPPAIWQTGETDRGGAKLVRAMSTGLLEQRASSFKASQAANFLKVYS